jgi:signal transduction histidine kinase
MHESRIGDLNPGLIADDQFVFRLVHDIRTQLRTVLTRLQIVQRSGGAQLPKQDQLMLEEATAAAGLINGLLSAVASHFAAGAGDGVMRLGLMVRGLLIEQTQALAAVEVETDIAPDSDVPVPLGLHAILKELLTNACKFRDAERPLRICIAGRTVTGDVLEIAVSDNGVGVDVPYLDKIFVPFQRLQARNALPGFGLGLATCRRIAAQWGGKVAAESRPAGGLTVQVTVPGLLNAP